jgi:hypothetical protein
MLPDDVLLEIFDTYVNEDRDEYENFKKEIEEWQTLVHVCQRWRSVVFASRCRLNLRLVCTPETPARNMLNVWPSLPLLVWDSLSPHSKDGVDDIIAVLEHSKRVVEINLFKADGSDLENILAAMQVPFPELTDLLLRSSDGKVSVLSDSFLGGSAPRLESLSLFRIPFPGLWNLLLSATHLFSLYLDSIPHSGYFSPKEIVAALSTFASLAELTLVFESPQSRPHWASRPPPPKTRSVLPALISFSFKGVGEYLDDVVARIDAPQLEMLDTTFFNQIVFDTPQLIQFISRMPTLKTYERARVVFENGAASFILSSRTSEYGCIKVKIPCIELDWQVSSMEQVCTSCLPPLSTSEDLYIYELPSSPPVWQDNIENALWVELLHPISAVKNIYLSEKFASRIVPALQERRTMEVTVLPALQNVFLEEPQPSGTVHKGIQQFVATRQATDHPIAVSRWDNSMQDMARYY